MMKITTKTDNTIEVLNGMLKCLPPIYLRDFNRLFSCKTEKNRNALIAFEAVHEEVGIAKYDSPDMGVSILSLIATITDCLVGKRLSVEIDDEDSARIVGFKWYELSDKGC
jgi:hypothetical protein